jgi:methylmalonyl-CoA/ethylmalonyl-CoA epimerase
MKIKRIDHITVAARDADAARSTFEQLLGAPPVDAGPIPAFGVRAVELALGDAKLEIVSPLDTDSAVMRFLERKGEGFYNLALEVDDLDAAVAELGARGIRVSDPVEPRPGMRASFVTMAATHGLSVQLVEYGSEGAPAQPEPVEASPVPEPEPEAAMPRAETEPTAAAPEPMPKAEASGDWSDAAPKAIDLTPDEWSDLD